MKILFIITSTELGGAEKALADLALSVRQTHQIKIVSLKPLGKIGEYLLNKGIDVVSVHMNKWNQWTIPAKIRQIIKQFRPDIVHAMLYRAIEFTRIACFGLPVKLITTPHYDLSKKFFLCRLMDKYLSGLDTLSVAESFSTAQYLINHQKYPKQKVYLLPNGVDKTRFHFNQKAREEMRSRFGFKDENVVFVTVARLEPVKNVILAVQAIRNVLRTCPQARLVIVGEGSQYSLLEQYIAENNLKEAVFLTGKQDNVEDYLSMADVFVLSSQEESLPLALLEAVSIGLPCLVTKVGDMPLWVEHGKNGFVFPSNDITLCSCFMTEMIVPPIRKQQQKESLKKAQDITASVQEYQKIYDDVLK